CVTFAYIRQKLIAEPFAFRGAAHEARDVDKRQPRWNDFLGARDVRERFEPCVGHRDIADIGLDGAKGIIRRLRRRRLRQCIEEGRFADIGQTDDAAFETHGRSTLLHSTESRIQGRCELRTKSNRLTEISAMWWDNDFTSSHCRLSETVDDEKALY